MVSLGDRLVSFRVYGEESIDDDALKIVSSKCSELRLMEWRVKEDSDSFESFESLSSACKQSLDSLKTMRVYMISMRYTGRPCCSSSSSHVPC